MVGPRTARPAPHMTNLDICLMLTRIFFGQEQPDIARDLHNVYRLTVSNRSEGGAPMREMVYDRHAASRERSRRREMRAHLGHQLFEADVRETRKSRKPQRGGVRELQLDTDREIVARALPSADNRRNKGEL